MILDEYFKLNLGSIVEFIVLDFSSLGGNTYRFHNGLNELGTEVVWQGNTYYPFPYSFQGISKSSQGTQARPTITLANVGNTFQPLIAGYFDLVGGWVTRKKTFLKYLDAGNFAAGNPTADQNAHFPDEKYIINRKVSENKITVQFELASIWDVFNAYLPARRVLPDICIWNYRVWNGSSFDYSDAPDCGYTGTNYFKADNTPTANPAEDECGKRFSSCKLRFYPGNALRFSSYPAVDLYY